jgi:hypothetical protein
MPYLGGEWVRRAFEYPIETYSLVLVLDLDLDHVLVLLSLGCPGLQEDVHYRSSPS